MAEHESYDLRIAFVDIIMFDDGAIRGGVLVTDKETRPYEFRVTSPIKPTKLQKLLYGASLDEYIYGQLVGLPLLKHVKEKVALAICIREQLLAARPDLEFPLVVLKKSSRDDSIVAQPHPSFPGEQAHAELIIYEMLQRYDLGEPFHRLKLAVSEVHTQQIDQKT